jgi:hypothetical protein
MTTASTGFAPRRARLGRYAWWQAFDFALNIAIVTILIFALLGVSFIMSMNAQQTFLESQGQSMSLGQRLAVFRQLMEMFTSVAPMIAMSGIVSNDRTSGFTRFLFAKPLSPPRYYAQSAAVRLVGYLAMTHLLMWWYSFYGPVPAYSWKAVATFTTAFLAIGGVLFLFSVVSRFDGLIAIIFFLVSAIAWDRWDGAGGIKEAAILLLPPLSKLGEIQSWFVGVNGAGTVMEMPFPGKWLFWLAGYGLACLVLGLVILRKAPLTKA